MDKESLTKIRVKNSFSIEDILARPDPDSENKQNELKIQNPYQNNHLIFCEDVVNCTKTYISENSLISIPKCDENKESAISGANHATVHNYHENPDSKNNESSNDDDDERSSVHSECFLIYISS